METFVVHPDDFQKKALKAFLEALDVPFEIRKEEGLPVHVLKGIEKGQDDIKAGRKISFAEFEQKIANR